jgi:hypothetical protein
VKTHELLAKIGAAESPLARQMLMTGLIFRQLSPPSSGSKT